MKKNSITQEHVDNILVNSKISFEKMGSKTLVGICVLPNGWVINDGSSCVDPANFDFEIGKEILIKRFENKIWELEGYLLQTRLADKL